MNISKHWRWAVAAASIFVPAIALGTVTIPFSFTSGTVIKAADMNSNFTALKTAVDALQAEKPMVLRNFDSSTINLSTGQSATALHVEAFEPIRSQNDVEAIAELARH